MKLNLNVFSSQFGISINNTQGQSLSVAEINVTAPVFSHGHLPGDTWLP